jgi:hypothetical protein
MNDENTLDLALDIDDTMGICFGLFEQRPCLARQQPYTSVLLFQQLRGGIVEDKTGGLFIRLESQFFCNESNVHIWFISASKS